MKKAVSLHQCAIDGWKLIFPYGLFQVHLTRWTCQDKQSWHETWCSTHCYYTIFGSQLDLFGRRIPWAYLAFTHFIPQIYISTDTFFNKFLHCRQPLWFNRQNTFSYRLRNYLLSYHIDKMGGFLWIWKYHIGQELCAAFQWPPLVFLRWMNWGNGALFVLYFASQPCSLPHLQSVPTREQKDNISRVWQKIALCHWLQRLLVPASCNKATKST